MSFVHLHLHTEYSVLDGAISVEKLVRAAVDNGMKAVAITDHGNMAGAVNFYQQAKKAGIKPIIGQEFYIAPKSRTDKSTGRDEDASYHLLLLATDLQGYKNLMKLSSIGYIEGFYYKPRIDREVLEKYKDGLICCSACLGGEIPSLIMKNRYDEAKETALYYDTLFGRDRFYLELQDHGIKEQKIVNKALAMISKETGIPLVATNDCHYLNKEDAFAHEVLLCVQTGKTITDEAHMKFDSQEFYFKSAAEMEKLFPDLPDAIYNTVKIADMCDVNLELGKPILPDFDVPEGHTLNTYMKELVYAGAHERFGKELPTNVTERIEYELSVIFKMDFSGYFLIVWDFINHARSVGIPVGPGRGSAAGSIVSYCLGITQLNPLDYNLLFERFLSPDRREMPDMDIDFCADRREEVIEYVRKKYGEEHVSQIITFGTMAAKAVVKDVARVLNLPFATANEITKMISEKDLEKSVAASKDLQQFYKASDENKQLIDISKKLEGLVRSFGKHAAGVVISRGPLTEYAPLYKEPKEGSICTQYDKIDAEAAGLVKMDFLGLKNLTVINRAVELIRKTSDPKFTVDTLPLDDKETYQLLQKGDTTGVFQLESPGMQNLLRRMGPTVFEDIIACGALFRPGPLQSGMADQFVQRKKNAALIKYPHPVLEPILNDTLGVIVYQEQVMKISQAMGGFTMGEADKLRKAMGKKMVDIVNDLREKFLKGAKEKKIDKSIAEEIYDAMSKFAEYGFNKSHAAAYGLVTYQTGYLKTHYRAEYMCALLSSYIGDQEDVTKYIADCKAAGIQILPPDVNKSEPGFSIEDGKIRFGLNAVKGLGSKAIGEMIIAREKCGGFTSLKDFLENVPQSVLNKGTLEAMIKSGSLATFEQNRARLMASIDLLSELGKRLQNEKKSGQGDLFGAGGTATYDVTLPQIADYPDNVKLAYEKEVLGLYLSGHPLEKFARELRSFSSCSTSHLEEKGQEGVKTVSLVGLIENAQKRISKKGKPYATALLEDLDGTIEIFFFAKTLEKFESLIFSNEIVMITGQLEAEEEKPMKILVDNVISIREARKKAITSMHINIDPVGIDETLLEKIKDIVEKNRGNCPLFFHVTNAMSGESIIKANSFFSVTPSDGLMESLCSEIGSDCVRFGFRNAC